MRSPSSFMPASRSVDFVGAKSAPVVTIGNETINFIFVFLCLFPGHKLPPIVIFKRKAIPKENFP